MVKAPGGSAHPQGPAHLGAPGTEAEGQGSRPHVPSRHADPRCPSGMARSVRGSQARAAGPPHSGQLAPGCLVGMQAEGRAGQLLPEEASARPTECARHIADHWEREKRNGGPASHGVKSPAGERCHRRATREIAASGARAGHRGGGRTPSPHAALTSPSSQRSGGGAPTAGSRPSDSLLRPSLGDRSSRSSSPGGLPHTRPAWRERPLRPHWRGPRLAAPRRGELCSSVPPLHTLLPTCREPSDGRSSGHVKFSLLSGAGRSGRGARPPRPRAPGADLLRRGPSPPPPPLCLRLGRGAPSPGPSLSLSSLFFSRMIVEPTSRDPACGCAASTLKGQSVSSDYV